MRDEKVVRTRFIFFECDCETMAPSQGNATIKEGRETRSEKGGRFGVQELGRGSIDGGRKQQSINAKGRREHDTREPILVQQAKCDREILDTLVASRDRDKESIIQ